MSAYQFDRSRSAGARSSCCTRYRTSARRSRSLIRSIAACSTSPSSVTKACANKGRVNLPAMSESRHRRGPVERSVRVLAPSGYLLRWIDTFGLCEGHHHASPTLSNASI